MKSRFTVTALLESYSRTNSLKNTADEFGLCAQSVHERLSKIGAVRPARVLSDDDRALIAETYKLGFMRGDGTLDRLAVRLDRTKQFVCRHARFAGLSNAKRSVSGEQSVKMSKITKQWMSTHTHPRGFLGGSHSESAKRTISAKSRISWNSKTESERRSISTKSLRTKLQKYGKAAPCGRVASWRCGWRTISGKRYFFRSRWEFNYALVLQRRLESGAIKSWAYEGRTFQFPVDNGCLSYLPDFEVVDCDGRYEVHEVKGWMDSRSREKLDLMSKHYPDIPMLVVDAAWFKSNEKRLSGEIPEWERNAKQTQNRNV